jgi:hypothetical protein
MIYSMVRKIGIFLLLLLSMSCMKDKCGDNISLGDYYIEEETKTDWYPYEDLSTLYFKNANNNVLVLQQAEAVEDLVYDPVREICREGFASYAEEYMMAEQISKTYRGGGHELSITLRVRHEEMSVEQLYDEVTFSSYGGSVGGSVFFFNDRGNNVNPDLIAPSYIDSIKINGVSYTDVYYFNRESSPGVFEPSLYVQKNTGIIAFLDDNGVIWRYEP